MAAVDAADAAAATAPVPAARAGGRAARALDHARTPLHRDAYALVVNSAFTAVTGLLYWVLAARLYSEHTVGVNAALISSMMFLAGVASLDLPNLVVRFLPEAGARARRVVSASYGASAAVAVLAAGVFLTGVDAWAPRLSFLASGGALTPWFVVATVAWTLFVIQDGVLTGLGRAVWVPVENAAFSVAKLGLLVAFASLLPHYGIFVSWTAAMLACVTGVSVVVLRRLIARPAAGAAAPRGDRLLGPGPGLVRYVVADYAAATAWLAAVNLLPVIVTAVAGATTTAWFALPWAVAFPLYAVAANVGTSLVLHGTAAPERLRELTRKAALQGLALLVPGVVLLVALAPVLLSAFGPGYAEHGTTLLRLLALAALPNLALALCASIARVDRRLGKAVVALWVQAAIALLLCAPLLRRHGVTGVGVAWLTSQCVVAAGLLLAALTHHRIRPRAARLRMRGADLVGGAALRRSGARRLARELVRPHAGPGWRVAPVRTDSDVVVFLAGPPDAPELAVKLACSKAGDAALGAHAAALVAMRRDPALAAWRTLLPRVVEDGLTGRRLFLVERALPGVDGRRFAGREDAVAAVAEAMAPLYAATGTTGALTPREQAALVDPRLERIAHACGRRAQAPLAALGDRLRGALAAGPVTRTRVHGDLWLGNALLAPDGGAVRGIVDWEASRAQDLPGVDIAHLVLSSRSLAGGAPVGRVATELLDGRARLGDRERALLEARAAPLAVDDLLLLAWAQHVVQRLTQSTLHAHGLWRRANVDPVLGLLAAGAA